MSHTLDNAALALQRDLDAARMRIRVLEAELVEELAVRSLPPDSPLRRNAESIQKVVDSGHRLSRQLLNAERPAADTPLSVDLNAVVDGVARTLGPVVAPRISMAVQLDPRAGAVGVTVAGLEQITMSLVLNARDAMPEGGRLVVSTSGPAANGHGAAIATLSVEDTGIRVGADAQSRGTTIRVCLPVVVTARIVDPPASG